MIVTNNARPDSEIAPEASTAAPHPEELRAAMRFSLGDTVSADATARATPAGLVALGLLVTAIAVPLLILAKRSRDGAAETRF
jgi:hypothetical protein